MTLDEAIEHAEERACGNNRYAKDHAQLADWLRELRRARMEIDLLKTLRDGFKADVQKYKAENAKLREERDTYRDLVGCMVHPDIPDQLAAENTKLRKLVRDMWRFTGTACKKYPRLFDPSAQGGQMVQLNMIDAFEQRMNELGVGVDE